MISIGTITISMLLLGAFLLLSFNINNWVKDWGESLSMSVYLDDGISARDRGKIETAISNLDGAKIKGFISKDQALINLKKSLGDQAGLLDGLQNNPLPASIEIEFQDIEKKKIDPAKIKTELEKLKGVNEVQYSEQWIERFKGIMNVIRIVGLIIGGFLCTAVLFITTNTIKLTIYSRREEIEIYKLVGATDWFVKMPYLIEGAIQGIIGGLLSFAILFLFYSLFTIKKIDVFSLPIMNFTFLSFNTSLLIILVSLILGFMGGLIALGRFFKT